MLLTNNQDSLYTVLPSDFLAFFEYALTQKVSVKILFFLIAAVKVENLPLTESFCRDSLKNSSVRYFLYYSPVNILIRKKS